MYVHVRYEFIIVCYKNIFTTAVNKVDVFGHAWTYRPRVIVRWIATGLQTNNHNARYAILLPPIGL